MRSIRVFFEKRGNLRFVSHLDMNRFFIRVLRKTGLPIWYTEGFNPHPYVTFALPLSLGFESTYEILDFKVEDDSISNEHIKESLEAQVPPEIIIRNVTEPVMKPGKIAYARFTISFENTDIAKVFWDFLGNESIVVTKRTKRGQIKDVDVASKIVSRKQTENGVELVLPAGNDNVNPQLIVDAFNKNTGSQFTASYIRNMVFDEKMTPFC